jgi:hypothetical protein
MSEDSDLQGDRRNLKKDSPSVTEKSIEHLSYYTELHGIK